MVDHCQPSRNDDMKQAVKIKLVALELKVSAKFVYKLIQEGKLKARECEIGGEVYIERAEIERYKTGRKKIAP